MTEMMTIDGRFNGPPTYGNGGYVAGRMATLLAKKTTITTLRAPTPVDKQLNILNKVNMVQLLDGEQLLVETATLDDFVLDIPAIRPSFDEAKATEANYNSFESVGASRCFVCGTNRHDGLRVFAGPLTNTDYVAAAFQPADDMIADGVVEEAYIHAALDCPGYYAATGGNCFALLGQMSTKIICPMTAGEKGVVLGWKISQETKKHKVGTALFGEDGRTIAYSKALWIETKPLF